MSKLIVDMEMNGIPDCCGLCDPLFMVVCAMKHDQTIDKMMLRVGRPSWCPIKGVLPDEHGDLVDRDEALYDIKRFICNGCNRETEDDCVACITKGIEDILCYIKPIIVAERKDDEK